MQRLQFKIRRCVITYFDHGDVIFLYPIELLSSSHMTENEPCFEIKTQPGLALAWLKNNFDFLPDEEIDGRTVKFRK